MLKIVPLLKTIVRLLKVFLFFYFQLLLDKRLLLIKIYLACGFLQTSFKLEKWQWRHNFLTWAIVNIFWHCRFFLVNFSYWSKFHVNIIVVLELWQISFIRDWPEIWKSEIPPSDFCLISGDWSKLGIPNLARMSLINVKPAKC